MDLDTKSLQFNILRERIELRLRLESQPSPTYPFALGDGSDFKQNVQRGGYPEAYGHFDAAKNPVTASQVGPLYQRRHSDWVRWQYTVGPPMLILFAICRLDEAELYGDSSPQHLSEIDVCFHAELRCTNLEWLTDTGRHHVEKALKQSTNHTSLVDVLRQWEEVWIPIVGKKGLSSRCLMSKVVHLA